MELDHIGQRCLSEPEPELGLGIVTSIGPHRIGVFFPAADEQRLYASDTSVLQRVRFREGETIRDSEGNSLIIESINKEDGLLVYSGDGQKIREDQIAAITSVSSPLERLMKAQSDEAEVFQLRYQALEARRAFKQSPWRGFLGGRVELLPHQFYILSEVAKRPNPRVLLADEVGLGKTIEACLILQRLIAMGSARRVLVIVPDSLVHQWFVELLRRFNLWFSIFDESRCYELEKSNPGGNPFLDEQWVLCPISFITHAEKRGDQAVEATWDMVVVDEAHHLDWNPDQASAQYEIVDRLAQVSPGLLLLTATPTQLGLQGHFARLRLLDPDRYDDYDDFLEEAEGYTRVAEVANKLVDKQALNTKDEAALKAIFNKDPKRLEKLLSELQSGKAGASDRLVKSLLDEHGTGRVMFRNTRANMTGFPKRQYCPAPLGNGDDTLINRMKRELQADASSDESSIRYSFKDDPRLLWLLDFLKAHPDTKVLLICRSQRKVHALETALKELSGIKFGVFHEALSLVQRDRNAAWFAEEDGAQMLICSEIGSEGRNFQFSHHLVLFDLPLNPGLLEQRIGRLDRIGQKDTIRIHVPYVVGSCQEFVLEWYHQGLDAFESPLHGGSEYLHQFGDRLVNLAPNYRPDSKRVGRYELEAFIEETEKFKRAFEDKLRKGRDRLLELNSFDRNTAETIVEQLRIQDADTTAVDFLKDLLDHFGVRTAEHEEGDVFIDPSHAYVEAFPSIPSEGMLATFQRERATAREDIHFVSRDHPLFTDALDLLINSPKGSSSFGWLESDAQNLLLEAVFVLETVSQSRWQADRFLPPTPIRVLVDIRGNDLGDEYAMPQLSEELQEGDLHRFLEMPGFTYELFKSLLEGAEDLAEVESRQFIKSGHKQATEQLGESVKRLINLRKINDHVRPDEITTAKEQLQHTLQAIQEARLRLDSLRLIFASPERP